MFNFNLSVLPELTTLKLTTSWHCTIMEDYLYIHIPLHWRVNSRSHDANLHNVFSCFDTPLSIYKAKKVCSKQAKMIGSTTFSRQHLCLFKLSRRDLVKGCSRTINSSIAEAQQIWNISNNTTMQNTEKNVCYILECASEKWCFSNAYLKQWRLTYLPHLARTPSDAPGLERKHKNTQQNIT